MRVVNLTRESVSKLLLAIADLENMKGEKGVVHPTKVLKVEFLKQCPEYLTRPCAIELIRQYEE